MRPAEFIYFLPQVKCTFRVELRVKIKRPNEHTTRLCVFVYHSSLHTNNETKKQEKKRVVASHVFIALDNKYCCLFSSSFTNICNSTKQTTTTSPIHTYHLFQHASVIIISLFTHTHTTSYFPRGGPHSVE